MESQMIIPNLAGSVGKKIWIDKGAPHEKSGILLAAKPDHLVLKTDREGIIYIQTFHIRRIEEDENSPSMENAPGDTFLDYPDFKELLKSMRYRMIHIDSGGPEKLDGVLADVDGDQVFLVRKDEVSIVSVFHIRVVHPSLQGRTEKSGGNESNNAGAKSSNGKDAKQNGKANQQKRNKRKKNVSALFVNNKAIRLKKKNAS